MWVDTRFFPLSSPFHGMMVLMASAAVNMTIGWVIPVAMGMMVVKDKVSAQENADCNDGKVWNT